MLFVDKTLVCRDCGAEFVFTAGEQEFYQSRGLENEPRRCPECRTARRQSRLDPQRQPKMYPAVCDACGVETEVPFEPRGVRPVYCKECFTKMREQR